MCTLQFHDQICTYEKRNSVSGLSRGTMSLQILKNKQKKYTNRLRIRCRLQGHSSPPGTGVTWLPGVHGRLLAVLRVVTTHAAVIAGHGAALLYSCSTGHGTHGREDGRVEASERCDLGQGGIAGLCRHQVVRVGMQECAAGKGSAWRRVGIEGQWRPVPLMALCREGGAAQRWCQLEERGRWTEHLAGRMRRQEEAGGGLVGSAASAGTTTTAGVAPRGLWLRSAIDVCRILARGRYANRGR